MNFNSYHFSEGIIQNIGFENYGNSQFLAVCIQSGSFVQSMPAFRLQKDQIEELRSHLLNLFEVSNLSEIINHPIYMLSNDMSILAIFPKTDDIKSFTFYGYLNRQTQADFDSPILKKNSEFQELMELLENYPMLKENSNLQFAEKIDLALINEAIANITKPSQLDHFFTHYMSQLLLSFNLENSLPKRENSLNKHKI